MVDVACGGGIVYRLPADTWRIMGELASNNHQWRSADRHIKRKEPQASGIFQVDQSAALASQVEVLTKQIASLMATQN